MRPNQIEGAANQAKIQNLRRLPTMKRFTETKKWDDPWFRKLRPEMKLLWLWLLDHCDNAGVIEPDIELAAFQVGHTMPDDALAMLGDRLVILPCGKWFIPKFIGFQYGELSRACKPHRPIFASLEHHGINATWLQEKGYAKGIHTLQEKEKEKEQEKETETDKETETRARKNRQPEPTGPDYANPEFFDNMQGKVRGLSREWSKPFMRSEMEELAANAEFFASVTEPEWIDLRFFMSAKTIPPELDAKAYWRPNSRLMFIRNAADMSAKAANFRRECRKAGYEVPEHPKDQP